MHSFIYIYMLGFWLFFPESLFVHFDIDKPSVIRHEKKSKLDVYIMKTSFLINMSTNYFTLYLNEFYVPGPCPKTN